MTVGVPNAVCQALVWVPRTACGDLGVLGGRVLLENAVSSRKARASELYAAMMDVAEKEGHDLDVKKPIDDLTVAEAIQLSKQVGPMVGAEDVEIDPS